MPVKILTQLDAQECVCILTLEERTDDISESASPVRRTERWSQSKQSSALLRLHLQDYAGSPAAFSPSLGGWDRGKE